MDGVNIDDLRESCLRRVGTLIDGKYALVDFLGMGATGAVYRATHNWVGRAYALKVFHYRGPDQQAALQRFVREAQAANRVLKHGKQHPYVVESFDVGRDRETGQFYIVQELLEGETLAQYLYRQDDHRVSEMAALGLLHPVLDAIGCAHESGIVHRDLKPENVFLATGPTPDDPLVKVLDFGIAQVADARMTPTYELLGTPQYMPPEAFNGAGLVDARADVWALGAILYEMVAGVPPFAPDGGGPFEVMKAITMTDPASLAASGLLSHTTWIAVRRALSKDPARRYRTARDLAVALEAAALGPRTLRVPTGATPASLREYLHAPATEHRRGGYSALRGEESDQAPPADPSHTWWSVTVAGTGHTAEEILALLALPELAHLAELHVAGIPLGDDGVRTLVHGAAIQDLTVLSLRKVSLGPAGTDALAMSPGVSGLVKLDLEDNALGDAGVRALGHSPYLTSLRTLNLVLTDLDARAARTLAESPVLAGITRLDLSQNRLGDEGARVLSHAPGLHPALHLAMGRNGLSRSAMEATAAELRDRIRKVVV